MKVRARKDGNQEEIVNRLRSLGLSVASTHQLGNGLPDIMVGFKGKNYWYEIKDPAQPPSKRRLTKEENHFSLSWKGHVNTVTTHVDILRDIGIMKRVWNDKS